MHDGVGLEPDEHDDVEEGEQQEHRPVAAQVGAPTPQEGDADHRHPAEQAAQAGEEDRRREVQPDLHDRERRPPEEHEQRERQHHEAALAEDAQVLRMRRRRGQSPVSLLRRARGDSLSEGHRSPKGARVERNGKKRVAIACQGGGSHTAFTAGALKRLLGDERYQVVALSGTSGGAICALLAWYALYQTEGRGAATRAAELLETFWKENAASEPLDRLWNDWAVWVNRFQGAVFMPAVSPYTTQLSY